MEMYRVEQPTSTTQYEYLKDLKEQNDRFKKLLDEKEKDIEELVEAGNEIDDLLVVPSLLGDNSKIVVQKAIDRFKDALKHSAKNSSGEKK
jgi:flagellar motility protein MotE (MotC chaperone)